MVLAVGMGTVLRSLLARLDSSPWGLLQAVPPLPIAAPLRQAAVLALQAAVQVKPYGAVWSGCQVINWSLLAERCRRHHGGLCARPPL